MLFYGGWVCGVVNIFDVDGPAIWIISITLAFGFYCILAFSTFTGLFFYIN